MSNEKMRAAFEREFATLSGASSTWISAHWSEDGQQYTDHQLHVGWMLWQAARAQPAEHIKWEMDSKSIRLLAAELIRAAECMGDDETGFVLEVRTAGTVKDDDESLNAGPILAIFDGEYPEEGVYPIDPHNPTAGREPEAAQPAGEAVASPLSRDRIREIFMAHGFTIKPGNDDLKDYVYRAAEALLAAAPPAQVPDGWCATIDPECISAQDRKMTVVSGYMAGRAYNEICKLLGGYWPDARLQENAPFAHKFFMELFDAAAPQPKGGE